jgi:hypothetical protein
MAPAAKPHTAPQRDIDRRRRDLQPLAACQAQ